MIRLALFVGIGGMVGSVFRFLISQWMIKTTPAQWPVATLIVNVLGSFILGLLFHYADRMDRVYFVMLASGFCGGFTTFSTFSVENINLFYTQGIGSAVLYIALSLVLSLAAAGGGWYLGKLYLA